MIFAEIKRNTNENTLSVIRRFSRKVKGSGVLRQVKDKKYSSRQKSDLKKKRDAIKRLTRHAEYERLKKLGKISDVVFKKSH